MTNSKCNIKINQLSFRISGLYLRSKCCSFVVLWQIIISITNHTTSSHHPSRIETLNIAFWPWRCIIQWPPSIKRQDAKYQLSILCEITNMKYIYFYRYKYNSRRMIGYIIASIGDNRNGCKILLLCEMTNIKLTYLYLSQILLHSTYDRGLFKQPWPATDGSSVRTNAAIAVQHTELDIRSIF